MNINRVHPLFAAEITGVAITAGMPQEQIDQIKNAIEDEGVICVRDQQAMTDDDQIAFCSRFGTLQKSISLHREDTARRMKRDELTDLSNVNADGTRIAENDTRRLLQLPGRLWHSDNSFRSPPGLYTFLAAKIVPPEGGDTEFSDMRAAYDALDDAMKAKIDGLQVYHNLGWSREQVGAPPLSENEAKNLPGATQPLVRFHPRSGRKSLYLSSHARDIVGMSEADGKALLRELTEFATQPQFVYIHKWREGDFVMWDNRFTMHRATAFPEEKYQRDMRRTSIEDHEAAIAA